MLICQSPVIHPASSTSLVQRTLTSPGCLASSMVPSSGREEGVNRSLRSSLLSRPPPPFPRAGYRRDAEACLPRRRGVTIREAPVSLGSVEALARAIFEDLPRAWGGKTSWSSPGNWLHSETAQRRWAREVLLRWVCTHEEWLGGEQVEGAPAEAPGVNLGARADHGGVPVPPTTPGARRPAARGPRAPPRPPATDSATPRGSRAPRGRPSSSSTASARGAPAGGTTSRPAAAPLRVSPRLRNHRCSSWYGFVLLSTGLPCLPCLSDTSPAFPDHKLSKTRTRRPYADKQQNPKQPHSNGLLKTPKTCD